MKTVHYDRLEKRVKNEKNKWIVTADVRIAARLSNAKCSYFIYTLFRFA